MPQNIDVRKALSADIPALETIKPRNETGYFERCLREQEEGKRETFIAALDGRTVGYGFLNWRPHYALYKKLHIPEIQDLNVLPDFRRCGVASAIIDVCEALATEKGCEVIGISVGLYKDYGPAQRLYVKRGYIPDGYGVTYDRETVMPGEVRPVDGDLCLMMVKSLR
ncbi:MAG: GNAT family N-acetyltransferase [Rhodospirillales bacterium]|nr:GNAT family N-acetyltransferase [Rhodospirillales bacterium]